MSKMSLSLISWEIVAPIVFVIYWLFVEILRRRGILEKKGITAIGPILMIRTTKGLEFLEKISKPKRFWRAVATLGIPMVFVGMAFMFFLILLMDYIMLTSPPKPSPATNPRNALLIPGINEFIPFVWGLIGLVVTLVVHELSHAILCRVEGVRVKSLGVLLALVPIGGFAEPDERELMDESKLRRIQRVRIYSAGVISNFIVAGIAFSAFFYLIGFLTPHVVVVDSKTDIEKGSVILSINGVDVYGEDDVQRVLEKSGDRILVEVRNKDGSVTTHELQKIAGVYISGTLKGYPAEKVGLNKGMVIVRVNDVETPTLKSFSKFMKSTKPNQTITIYAYDGESVRRFEVTLAKAPNGEHGFIGILLGGDYLSGMILGYSDQILAGLKSIPSQLLNVRGWLYIVSMPFVFRGFSENILSYFTPTDFWKDKGNLLFYLLNVFYWVGWINFYVGLFNCLPAIPLDGGRIFQESLMAVFKGERGRDISIIVVRSLAIAIFMSILLSILIPNMQALK
jgi:membrane-associated protease RseP (regulator of RpoE activity)